MSVRLRPYDRLGRSRKDQPGGLPSPADSEEVENYFMKEVAEGEMLCQDRKELDLA